MERLLSDSAILQWLQLELPFMLVAGVACIVLTRRYQAALTQRRRLAGLRPPPLLPKAAGPRPAGDVPLGQSRGQPQSQSQTQAA